LCDLCTGVSDVGIAVRLLDDPGEVFVDVGGVDAQEKMLRSQAIDGEVIDDPPMWITERRVLNLVDFELRRIIGGEPLHHFQCPRSRDFDLSHVADVKETYRGAHSSMLLDDTRILHRHFPTAEVNEFGARFAVQFEERRPLQADGCLWCHSGVSLRGGVRSSARI
jgi:hypothetical protein